MRLFEETVGGYKYVVLPLCSLDMLDQVDRSDRKDEPSTPHWVELGPSCVHFCLFALVRSSWMTAFVGVQTALDMASTQIWQLLGAYMLCAFAMA